MEEYISDKTPFNTQQFSSAWDIRYVAQTGSTNKDAVEAAKSGAPHLACFIAEEQTAGRGRRGRSWSTFPYKSIACSIIVRENADDTLPLLISLVLAKAISQEVGIDVDIKWPNDLLIENKKLAGILVESFREANKDVYIVGIGLNINKPNDAPKDIPFITLQDAAGRIWSREDILDRILSVLAESLQIYGQKGWMAFVDEYSQRCITLGKEVCWQNGEHTLQGIAEGIEADGALRLLVDGKTHLIRTGEIIAQGNIKT